MFLYNVTLIVEESIHLEWLAWAKLTLVPEMMASSVFTSCRMLRVVDSPNEGMTYCLQFFVANRVDLDRYLSLHHQETEHACAQKFGQNLLLFSTIMEYIE